MGSNLSGKQTLYRPSYPGHQRSNIATHRRITAFQLPVPDQLSMPRGVVLRGQPTQRRRDKPTPITRGCCPVPTPQRRRDEPTPITRGCCTVQTRPLRGTNHKYGIKEERREKDMGDNTDTTGDSGCQALSLHLIGRVLRVISGCIYLASA
jgi:hypothetical protein